MRQEYTVQKNKPLFYQPIHSYARRGAARMTDAQRRAYRQLANQHIIQIDRLICAPDTFLNPNRPLVIDIGSGMGQATAQLGRQRAHINYLACEVYRPGVARLLWYIERYQLSNVKIIENDCVPLLLNSSNNSAQLLEGAHIHFPDPWPKTRHHKRRLIDQRFLRMLIPLLRPAAYLSIVTDNAHYAHAILQTIHASTLINPYAGYAPTQLWRPATAFEQRARRAQRPIYELFLRRAIV